MTSKGKTSVTRILKNAGEAPKLFQRCILLKPASRALWAKASRYTKSSISIGSAEGNDLVLQDDSVSRHHARIDVDEGCLTITDLSSTNGTFVRDVRVMRAALPEKATLTFGDCDVVFRLGEESDEVPLASTDRFGEFLGESVPARRLFQELMRIAPSEASVVLEGESGTGKEILARAIHEESPRRDAPFVTIDCGALPASLIESELFGHERGAFTGAIQSRAGAFEQADGGTVFLDEIGELDRALQPKLLRVLEARTVRRVGSSQTRSLDVRVIAATNRDLQREMARGEFREDLYYRLAIAHLRIPPLRERREDIPLLASHILSTLRAAAPEHPNFHMTSAMMNALSVRSWRGNVRELRNVLHRAYVTSELEVESAPTEAGFPPISEVHLDLPYAEARHAVTNRFERTYLRHALEAHKGNVAKTARECGMDRTTLFRLIKKHDLKRAE